MRSQLIVQGISLIQLRKRLGFTFQQIYKYETGTSRITSGRLEQIAKELKVPISLFFNVAPGKGTGVANINEVLSLLETAGSELVRAFAAFKMDGVRESFILLAEGIAKNHRGGRNGL
jgi:transcriptional regulator with XRE-family HTH domain